VRSAVPGDAAFCAMRAWSQREEVGFMREIENEFQPLADAIINGTLTDVAAEENQTISRFFALWYMRARHRKLSAQEMQAQGIAGESLTKDQEERLEKEETAFVRKGGKFVARQLNGLQLQLRVGIFASAKLASIAWGVIHAQEGEFLVPDVPEHSIIPLTPTICLAANALHGTILKSNVAVINRALQSASQEYFFARDFSKCPT
jgi:hypothetical protein